MSNPSEDWPRPVVHWALTAKDPEKQKAFYAALFSWTIGEGFIMNVQAGLGGPEPGPAGHIQPGDAPGFSLYVQVPETGAASPADMGKVMKTVMPRVAGRAPNDMVSATVRELLQK